jgi:serine protease Do
MWCPVAEIQWDFHLTDFRNRMRLATQIGKRNDPVSKSLWERFSDDTKKLFEGLDGPLAGLVQNELIRALISELNSVLERTDLYDPQRFANIHLRDEVAPLLTRQLTSEETLLLNRMLLESAYPGDIVRSGKIEGLAAEIVYFFWDVFSLDEKGDPKPKTLDDFLNACEHFHHEQYRDLGLEVRRFCHNLIAEGLLFSVGFDPNQRYPYNEQFLSYFFSRELAVYGSYEFVAFGFAKIRDHFSNSVVKLKLTQGGKTSIGTGFLIDDRRIITAEHCVPSGSSLEIEGCNATAKLKKILTFKNKAAPTPTRGNVDIAVLEFDSDPFPNTPKFKLWSDAPLEDVLAMGYPPLKGFTSGLIASKGEIISKEISKNRDELMIIFSATIKGGNSGGPIINLGKVVGIVTHLLRVSESDIQKLGYGLAFPAQRILDLLNLARGKESDNDAAFAIKFVKHGNAVKILT